MLAFLGTPESAELIADGDLFLDGPKCGMLLVDETITAVAR
jgi:hypothetical protein